MGLGSHHLGKREWKVRGRIGRIPQRKFHRDWRKTVEEERR